MKKLTKFVLLFVIIGLVLVAFAACDNGTPDEPGDDTLKFDMVYAYAVDAGYTGTMEQLIELFKGDSAYALACKAGYQGTEQEWLASLVGAKGEDGITPTIGENGHWWIGNTDTGVTARGEQGIQGVQGEQGIQGDQGIQGETGNGIESMVKTSSTCYKDIYTVTFTDGTSTTVAVTYTVNGRPYLTQLRKNPESKYTFVPFADIRILM